MPLRDGESEIDAITIRLPDYGREIRNWQRYTFNQAFLTPTASWSFTVSDEDKTLADELLVPGARVELALNDRMQCTGHIDARSIEASASGGTLITIQGRDILGRVVDSCIDPAYKFTAGKTVLDVILAVLERFGIDSVYSEDDLNVGVITGLPKSATPTTSRVQVQVPKRVAQGDGTVTLEYETRAGTVVGSSTRRDLRTITLDQIKPRLGEGVFAFIDRVLKRFGLVMWAAADGSGVVVTSPDYTTAPVHRIIRRRTDPGENNVEDGRVDEDRTTQPSVIVAFGFGGGRQAEKSRLKVIGVNELVGLADTAGSGMEPTLNDALPHVKDIFARYRGARVLPIRPELVPFRRPIGAAEHVSPMFLKDDESRTIEQLEAFVRRELAARQHKALVATYTVLGHTFRGHPWSMNTLVDVDDEVAGLHRPLWVLDRTFRKTPSGGTKSTIRLALPYTMQVSR